MMTVLPSKENIETLEGVNTQYQSLVYALLNKMKERYDVDLRIDGSKVNAIAEQSVLLVIDEIREQLAALGGAKKSPLCSEDFAALVATIVPDNIRDLLGIHTDVVNETVYQVNSLPNPFLTKKLLVEVIQYPTETVRYEIHAALTTDYFSDLDLLQKAVDGLSLLERKLNLMRDFKIILNLTGPEVVQVSSVFETLVERLKDY